MLHLLDDPFVQVVVRERRIHEVDVVVQGFSVVRVVGFRVELSGCVVAASVLVLGEDVFHAVVVEEVGGVVVGVEVFVAPEMAF